MKGSVTERLLSHWRKRMNFRKLTIIGGISLFLLTAPLGVSAKELKVGIVDLSFVVQNSEKGKKAKAYMEAETKKEQTIIQNREKELRALINDFSTKSFLLDEELKKTKAQEAQKKKIDLKRYVEDSRARLQDKQNELMGQILKELTETINKYGENHNFSYIIEKNAPGLYFHDKSLDITQKILDLYNKKHK